MKHTISIDLRKADPLGLDVLAAYSKAKDCYADANRMGPGDSGKPGYFEHNREYYRLLGEARAIHGLLIVIAKLCGPKATENIPALKWAMGHNFLGYQMIEPR